MSTLPRTNWTTLNYDSILISPMEQRKPLKKGGLCWDGTFVIGEHVARIASAELNGDGWGGGGGGGGGGARTATKKRVVELGARTGLAAS